jgi:hypothetical protein
MDVQCTACKENVRKDTLLSHIKKNHPSYLWDNIFCTYSAVDPNDFTLRTKRNVRTAINILEDARIPYELDEDIHADFGSNTTYSTDKTAIKHILDHPMKHKENFLELLKDGLTTEKMIALLTWVMGKPTQIIMDDRIIASMKRDMEEKERAFQDKMEEMSDSQRHLQKMYDSLREGEEQQQIQQLKQQVYDYASENRKLATICKELTNTVRSYQPDDAEIESKNRTNLMTEQKEWDVYEKMRDDLQKKGEKAATTHKKEVEKLTSSYEKKESKYKKEIKALKHQIKTLKLKIATPDSDSDSGSSSDSD